MVTKLLMRVVIIALDRGCFEGAVHALHLPIGPGMTDFGQTMLNAVGRTNAVKEEREGIAVLGTISELDAVISENGVDLVWHGRNQATWEKKGLKAASERFDHYYSEAELKELVPHITVLAAKARQTHVVFNVNRADQGQRGAAMLQKLLPAER